VVGTEGRRRVAPGVPYAAEQTSRGHRVRCSPRDDQSSGRRSWYN